MIKTFSRTYSRTARSLFISNSGLSRFYQVTEAILLANELLQNPEFYYRIAAHPGFEMADVAPEIIAGLLCETQLKMTVDLYYALDAQKNIDGYDDLNNPSSIHLNIWKINRSAASICNSIIHGCVHAVNAYNPFYSFGHGAYPAMINEHTAPYWIGALAQRMVSTEEPIILPLEHDPNKQHVQPILNDCDAIQSFSQSMWLTC